MTGRRLLPDVVRGVGHRDEHGNFVERYHMCGCVQPGPERRSTVQQIREWVDDNDWRGPEGHIVFYDALVARLDKAMTE
jgi:hypothetical protein